MTSSVLFSGLGITGGDIGVSARGFTGDDIGVSARGFTGDDIGIGVGTPGIISFGFRRSGLCRGFAAWGRCLAGGALRGCRTTAIRRRLGLAFRIQLNEIVLANRQVRD
ncbi:MAG: hypothetical protein E4H19_14410 [Chromatiales bacterium]|nr:MAG: hypothetical protein E4H19_14410 [Chromatiales bacterium]